MKFFSVNRILWAVYLSLLAVLLPHTAWAFHNFEPETKTGTISVVAWTAAFAFEASIAVLMHKLSGHIDRTPRRVTAWAKFRYRYLNAYSLGLLAAIAVSSLANLAHAVEFGRPMAIFTVWNFSFNTYAFAFGAVLPLVSLVFARVLSNVVETDGDEDPALVEAQKAIADLRRQLRESETQRKVAEEARQQAEDRYASAVGTLMKIVSADKRERILAAHRLWQRLPGAALAIIADASPSYVSEVLKADTNADTLEGKQG
jgi:PAS domain-containing protein